MKISRYEKQNNGFTIIETLVAIAILMIAIAGPLTIVHKGLLAAVYAHDQVTASYLAQDAMEFVKNVRDSNLLNSRTWLDKLSQCTKDNYCSVNTLTGNPNAMAGTPEAAGIMHCSSSCLLYNSSSGYSPDNTGTPTQFSRYFYIQPASNNGGEEAKIVVLVIWKNGTVENAVTYENEVFNIIK